MSDTNEDTRAEERKYSKACNSCKEKKRRCDRATPKCGYCERHSLPCEFRTLKKPGLRTGYGSAMLDKLDSMENNIQDNHDSSIAELHGIYDFLKQIDSKVLGMMTRGEDSHRQLLSIENLTNGSKDDPAMFHDSSNGSYTDHMVFNGNGSMHHKEMPQWRLPQANIIRQLVDIYFEKIYPGFRVLHPTSRKEIFETVDRIHELSDPTNVPPQILGVILCSLRFAGDLLLHDEEDKLLAFCRTTILSQCIGFALIEQLQAMALLAYDSYGRSNNPVTWSYISLISNAVIHLNLTKEPVERIEFRGQPNAMRTKKAKIISPQSVANLKAPSTSFDEECRRNLFWEIFLLDCLSSVSNSLPCKIIENDINRLVPVRLDVWGTPGSAFSKSVSTFSEDQTLDSSSYLVEVVRKLRKIHTFLREPFDINNFKEVLAWQMQLSEIDGELIKWKESIPYEYQQFLDDQSTAFTQKLTVKDVLFFSIYHMTVIRLNSSVAYQNFDSNFFILSSTAKEKCIQSANFLASFSSKLPLYLDHLNGDIYLLCGPFFAFALWVAARLLFVDALRSGEDFKPEFDQLVSALSITGTLWESATRYSDILSFLKSEEIENRAKGLSLLAGSNSLHDVDDSESNDSEDTNKRTHHSKSARMFADMRFNAYSLDVSLSKKIDQYKKNGEELSPNNKTDFTNLLEWFKIPISMENSPFLHKMDV